MFRKSWSFLDALEVIHSYLALKILVSRVDQQSCVCDEIADRFLTKANQPIVIADRYQSLFYCDFILGSRAKNDDRSKKKGAPDQGQEFKPNKCILLTEDSTLWRLSILSVGLTRTTFGQIQLSLQPQTKASQTWLFLSM